MLYQIMQRFFIKRHLCKKNNQKDRKGILGNKTAIEREGLKEDIDNLKINRQAKEILKEMVKEMMTEDNTEQIIIMKEIIEDLTDLKEEKINNNNEALKGEIIKIEANKII